MSTIGSGSMGPADVPSIFTPWGGDRNPIHTAGVMEAGQ